MKTISLPGTGTKWLVLLLAAILSTARVDAKPSPQQVEDFKANYESKVNQWLDGRPEHAQECLSGIAAYSWECRHEPHRSMILYSAHGPGDLGS